MDHMFQLIGAERKEVVVEVQYISQSEDEQDELAYLIDRDEALEMAGNPED